MRKKIWKGVFNTAFLALALFCAFNAGRAYEIGFHWALTVLYLAGAVGWLSMYIQNRK